jgi:uncharacterized protein YbjT (DUF2867 family)
VRVLVLGAYGLIGADIVRVLLAEGYEAVGLVRSKKKAARLLPDLHCVEADIATLRKACDWRTIVSGFDVVVNASGALQDSFRDRLTALQDDAIRALIDACEGEGVRTFVQISAPGADKGASTRFMRSKGAADDALRISGLNWIIFKPGLVISRTAYGGTALIRALAGFPVIQPMVMGDVRIQAVSSFDVAKAVASVISEDAPAKREYDLASERVYSLGEMVSLFRRWLGVAPTRMTINLPSGVGFVIAKIGDVAGWLGWRSPLRTTALRVLANDVVSDGAPWVFADGRPLKTLEETLTLTPSTLQDRVFAKTQLLTPLVILALSLFFILSGVVALLQVEAAAGVIAGRVSEGVAQALVIGGVGIDIALGAAILIRPFAKTAAVGMIALSLIYLFFGTIFAPALWIAPLGPFVKIFPVIGLALVASLIIEER